MDQSGDAPGRIVPVRQRTPIRLWRRSRVASTPARTSDDLPLPEGPMIETKWFSARMVKMSWISRSRPRKIGHSAFSNGRSPG